MIEHILTWEEWHSFIMGVANGWDEEDISDAIGVLEDDRKELLAYAETP